jgi:carboxypeptidase Taq
MKKNYFELSADLAHIHSAYSLLYWDMETAISKGALEWRSHTLGYFAGLIHSKTNDLELEAALKEAISSEKDTQILRCLNIDLKEILKNKSVPEKLAIEMSKAHALSHAAWAEAKNKNDFSIYAPHLKKMISLAKEMATCFKNLNPVGTSLYNVLLEEFSPGMTTKKIDTLFSDLRKELVTLVKEKQIGREKAKKIMKEKSWRVPIKIQEKLCSEITEWMGFPQENLVQAISTHPFCLSLHPSDVRITTRYAEDDPMMSLMSTVHELGHGLYEHQLSSKYPGTSQMKANGMDLHESQSRFWEVCLGTSKEFFEWVYDWYQKNASECIEGLTSIDLFHLFSVVGPSLIRTESDPVTYGLHIMIRYELEKKIIDGEVDVEQLPDMWNKAYEEYLGISASSMKEGILQDGHWASGSFGYFPSYLLGTMIACQLHEKATDVFPDLNSRIRNGNLVEIKNWLKENVHIYGKGKSVDEILTATTGKPLESRPFLTFLKKRFYS